MVSDLEQYDMVSDLEQNDTVADPNRKTGYGSRAEGKVAIVGGASKGLGRACAQVLARKA